MATLEQKIAQKQDELARLKEQSRKLENGQKIIIGSMMLSLAKKDPLIAKLLLDSISSEVTRKTDLDRLETITTELKSIVNKANEQTQSQQYNNYQAH